MSSITFTLDPYISQPDRAQLKDSSPRHVPATVVGRRGVIGELGEVAVEHTDDRAYDGGAQRTRAQVRGAAVPAVVLTGRAVWGSAPSLDQAELTVDGAPVALEHNVMGAKNTARALRFSHAGHAYTYTVLPRSKGAELRRDGVRVLLEPVKGTGGRRITRGTVEGPAEAVDVALAVLFEEVDTGLLSLKGAAAHAPFHLLDRLARPNRAPGQ
ncbi:hypothetical protein ACQUSR_19070 [Streptomyces sp. P1-3]|uniref:hypothetical protein n=1 Tax=Streptomyces sp. P1-3 TaxID=3421658 RepID=UPI003D36BFC0